MGPDSSLELLVNEFTMADVKKFEFAMRKNLALGYGGQLSPVAGVIISINYYPL